jgi:hypothetical protein
MSRALEETVADRLWEALVTGVPCPPVRHDLWKDNISGAYRIASMQNPLFALRWLAEKLAPTDRPSDHFRLEDHLTW